MHRQFKVFFATINLSCLLSTWISFDLREKDASKNRELASGGAPEPGGAEG